MQNEWDDLMLETYTLKQHLDSTRQELSQALYQQDASSRVIARLLREKEELIAQLQSQRSAMAQAAAKGGVPIASENPMEVEDEPVSSEPPSSIPQHVMDDLTETWKNLTKARKKRVPPANLCSPDSIAGWTEKYSTTLHKTTPAGITCMSLNLLNPDTVITGGLDKTAILFNFKTGVQLANMMGHEKKILDVAFAAGGSVALSSSSDCSARAWSTEDGSLLHTFRGHKNEVTSVCGHPTGKYIGTASRDKAWSLYELERGTCLRRVEEPGFEGGYECARWHPDGLILAAGTEDAQVRIWDMKSQTNVASFKGHEGGFVGSVAFSENGYYMASGGSDGSARLWDLRKLKNFQTIALAVDKGNSVKVSFDPSGHYLAASNNKNVEIHIVKEWSKINSFGSYKKPISSIAFGPDAQFILISSMDRTLCSYS